MRKKQSETDKLKAEIEQQQILEQNATFASLKAQIQYDNDPEDRKEFLREKKLKYGSLNGNTGAVGVSTGIPRVTSLEHPRK